MQSPENALELEGVGKGYRIYPSPMHRLKEIVLRKPQHRLFHALTDISFHVPRGQGFGVVGENGAGKSTLLKILANTLKPTSGTINRSGRVAALLELGAGFNMELTGDENIFLNGYLLGLSKGEIQAKKKEIIEFSEIGEFMDRPVKNYSTGMVVRLAFSIATSVDPDILIIDEALSVGDLHFQKKCIDRMTGFRRAGKTLVFCSHSMYFVNELCPQALWIHHGEMRRIGAAAQITTEYENYARGKSAGLGDRERPDAPPSSDVWIEEVSLEEQDGVAETVCTGDAVTVSVRVRCSRSGLMGYVGIAVIRNDDIVCFGTTTKMDGLAPVEYRDGQVLRFVLPENPLLAGEYFIHATLGDDSGLHAFHAMRSKPFRVREGREGFGIVTARHSWEV